jgi:hypothetical protein
VISLALALCVFGCGRGGKPVPPAPAARPPAKPPETAATLAGATFNLADPVAWSAAADPSAEKSDFDRLRDFSELPVDRPSYVLCSAPPGRFLAAVTYHDIAVRELPSTSARDTVSARDPRVVALEPEGRWIAFAEIQNDWSVKAQRLGENPPGTVLKLNGPRDGGPCACLAFAGRDTLLAVFAKSLVTWDLKEGRQTGGLAVTAGEAGGASEAQAPSAPDTRPRRPGRQGPRRDFTSSAGWALTDACLTQSPGRRYAALLAQDRLLVFDVGKLACVGNLLLPDVARLDDSDARLKFHGCRAVTYAKSGKEIAVLYGNQQGTVMLAVVDVAKGRISFTKQVPPARPFLAAAQSGSPTYGGAALVWLPHDNGWLLYGHGLVGRGGESLGTLPPVEHHARWLTGDGRSLQLDRQGTTLSLEPLPGDVATIVAAGPAAAQPGVAALRADPPARPAAPFEIAMTPARIAGLNRVIRPRGPSPFLLCVLDAEERGSAAGVYDLRRGKLVVTLDFNFSRGREIGQYRDDGRYYVGLAAAEPPAPEPDEPAELALVRFEPPASIRKIKLLEGQGIRGARFAGHDRLLVFGGSEEKGSFALVDLASADFTRHWEHAIPADSRNWPQTVATSPGGTYYAFCGVDAVEIRLTDGGATAGRWPLERSAGRAGRDRRTCLALAFSPDGSKLAGLWSLDAKRRDELRVWDLAAAREVLKHELERDRDDRSHVDPRGRSIRWLADGRYLALDDACVVRAEDGAVVAWPATLHGDCKQISLAPDRRLVVNFQALAGGTICPVAVAAAPPDGGARPGRNTSHGDIAARLRNGEFVPLPMRTWHCRPSAEEETFDGQLVGCDRSNKIYLQTADGRVLTLNQNQLSEADREYVAAFTVPRRYERPDDISGPGRAAALAALKKLATCVFVHREDEDSPLVGLDFSHEQRHASDADLKAARLDAFTRLRTLNLSGARLTDKGLALLEGLTALEAIDLTGTGVTDAGLQRLRNLKRLKLLIVAQTKVTGSGLAGLAMRDSLEGLHLNATAVTDAGLAELAGYKNLRRMTLLETHVSDAGLRSLGELDLEALDLGSPNVADPGMDHLKKCSRLGILTLWGTQVTPRGLKKLQGLPITGLTLVGRNVDDESLAVVGGCKQLAKLWLGDAAISDEGLRGLRPLTQLVELRIGRAAITDAGLARLEPLQALVELALNETQVTDAGIVHLKKLPHLRRVETWHSRLSESGRKELDDWLHRTR